MLAVVPDRRNWLRSIPLDVVIVVLTPPILPASLQSLRVFRLLRLLRLAQLSRRTFSLEGVKYAAILAFSPSSRPGPPSRPSRHDQHLTAWEGVYWAMTTMTTVGSNIYPTTTGGRSPPSSS